MIAWLLKRWVNHLAARAAVAKHNAHMAMRCRDGSRYAQEYAQFHEAFRQHQRWLSIYDDHLIRRRIRKCR